MEGTMAQYTWVVVVEPSGGEEKEVGRYASEGEALKAAADAAGVKNVRRLPPVYTPYLNWEGWYHPRTGLSVFVIRRPADDAGSRG
jgi:hypothetical protein